MADSNWLKKNAEKLDRVEKNDDKAFDLFVEVCTSLMEERDRLRGTEEFCNTVLACHRILAPKLDIERDYVTFVRKYFRNIDVVDYRLFKSGLALPSMVKALKLYLIYYKEYKSTAFELSSIASFLKLDNELSSKHNKDTWNSVLESVFNGDLDKAYELLILNERNQESFWDVRQKALANCNEDA